MGPYPLIISGQVERPQEKYQQAQVAAALDRAAEMGKDGIVQRITRSTSCAQPHG